MSAAVFRDGCGTYLGLRLHQELGEDPCSQCLRAEALRSSTAFLSLEREGIPVRPPVPGERGPVTETEAKHNAAVLEAALAESARARRAAA